MSAARRGAVAIAAAAACATGVVWWASTARAQRAQGLTASWEVRIPDKLELVAGEPASLPIALAVDRGLTISKDAGVYIDLAPPAGVVIKRRRWQRTDAVDPGADEPRFTVPVRADAATQAASDAALAVHVRFWVCGDKVCRPVDVRRSVAISIAAAPAPIVDAGVLDAR